MSAGGVTVRLSAEDAESVTIGFFDAQGTDIAEGAQRKIERIFYREDFRRCLASETGDITYPIQCHGPLCAVVARRKSTSKP